MSRYLPGISGHVPWQPYLHDGSRLAASQVRSRHQIPVIHQAPYAGRMAPLTGAAASLTRNAITPAIASGAAACAITSAGNVARLSGVSSSWGATAFTRI